MMHSSVPDFLAFAESLAKDAVDDVSRRCAVNRLYYSAFHACRLFHSNLPAPGTVGNSSGTHAQLISQLAHPTFSKQNRRYAISQALSKSLRGAFAKRVNADYRLDIAMSDDDVKETLGLCKEIVIGAGFVDSAPPQVEGGQK